jgi:hypothetical protein
MLAPVIPTQNLTIGGGATFKVDAPAGSSAGVIDGAVREMTENFMEAVDRIARRGTR